MRRIITVSVAVLLAVSPIGIAGAERSPETKPAAVEVRSQTPGSTDPNVTTPLSRIAMLWSPADLPGKSPRERINNWARHSLIVVGPEDLGLEWVNQPHKDMAEEFQPDSVRTARQMLGQLHQRSAVARVMIEIYFFEAQENAYPPDSPWWQRDPSGRRPRFWPGCFNMDLSQAQYLQHIARRIAAVASATQGQAGIYLDNLRLDPAARAGWTKLLAMVRAEHPDLPILVNAGWDSADLEWIAPSINGLMYEDAVAHTQDQQPEAFYARIAATDRLLREPRLSINERFGPRKDAHRMERDWLRTLVYTDMHFLYADSTNGHRHAWWPQWDLALGPAMEPPIKPQPGKLARRRFAQGMVAWLPESSREPVMLTLDDPMRIGAPPGQIVREVKLEPGHGLVLTRVPE